MNITQTLKHYMFVLDQRKEKYEIWVGDISVYKIVEQTDNYGKTIYCLEGLDSNGNQSVFITDHFCPIIKIVKNGIGKIPTFSDKL